MLFIKNNTNNAVVVELENVRPHPNADRLQLATVLGATVVVGLESETGDIVVYFDSNLCLSKKFLSANNLYSQCSMNADLTTKGYFGNNGRVKAQKFRGEISNGFVVAIKTLFAIPELGETLWSDLDFKLGLEFQVIDDVSICQKYIPKVTQEKGLARLSRSLISRMFHKHWDTKQLMRNLELLTEGEVWVEEKVHGTSGRIGYMLCDTGCRWWQIWKPSQEWRILNGTRNVDFADYHISQTRKAIEEKVAPLLRKGEQIYFEIFGQDMNGKDIQKGFSYGFEKPVVMLYRVTVTTLDGMVVDLNRKAVYRRAEELGLLPPIVIERFVLQAMSPFALKDVKDLVLGLAKGQSYWDEGTLLEGVVVWYCNEKGVWSALKHKSEEFLMLESRNQDKGIDDVENEL